MVHLNDGHRGYLISISVVLLEAAITIFNQSKLKDVEKGHRVKVYHLQTLKGVS